KYTRVPSSMPNPVTSNNPLEAGFLGDHMWLDLDSEGRALLAWADTRQHAGTAPEEDVYYARVPALSGPAPPPPPPPPPPPQPPPAVRCQVPRVIGLRLAAARTRIRRARCSVGRIRRASSRRAGRVIGQSPRPGPVRPRGPRVNLVVGRR